MVGTKRKSISNSSDSPISTKKTISTPVSEAKSNNKRKLSDPPLPKEDGNIKKSNRTKTPTQKILESGIAIISPPQGPQPTMTAAEQRQKAIEWAKEALPNLKKTPKTPTSTKKEVPTSTKKEVPTSSKKEVSNTNSSQKATPVIEPNSKKTPEKTITVPAINTPVPKKEKNRTTAQKRIRVKEISISTDDKKVAKPLLLTRKESYQLTIPGNKYLIHNHYNYNIIVKLGSQGFVYAIPIFIIVVYIMYLKFFS